MTESLDSDASQGTEIGSVNIGEQLEHESEDEDWNPWFLDGDRDEMVEYIELSQDDMSSVSEGPPEREPQWKELKELHKEGDYWQIQKLIKFVKVGDQTSTAVALACLADFDYSIPANQVAFVDSGGVELLINLLETNDFRCQVGAIIILSKICISKQVQRSMLNLGAVPTLLRLLGNSERELQTYAAITIEHIAKQRTCRTIVRKKGGIAILVELSDNPDIALHPHQLAPELAERLPVTKACVSAISALARSMGIRQMLYTRGVVKLFPFLLKSPDRDVVISTLKIIMHCTSLIEIIKSLESGGHLKLLVKHLYNEDTEKEEIICKILFKCAQSERSRTQIGRMKLLHQFPVIVKRPDTQSKVKKLKYCVGTLWRASLKRDNLLILDESNIVPVLVQLLNQKNIWVRTYVAGCLAELTRFKHNQLTVLKVNGLEPLVYQANNEWYTELLENLAKVIGNCAESPECASELDRLDALRIVWSLLDGKTDKLQVNAGRALVSIVRNAKDIGEKIRCLEGGKELLMLKLKSNNVPTVAAACAALAEVMTDEENLAILSELHVVEQLTKLTSIEDDELRESLSRAIASCSMSRTNGALFGRLGALTPIVGYLASSNLNVVIAAAFALWKLSIEPINCITLHRSGVVPFLLECVGSEDYRLQEAAAGCLNNLRQLTFEADQRKHLRGRVIAEANRPKHFDQQYTNLLNATTVSELFN